MDIIPEQNLIIPPNAMHGDTHWCAAGIHCMVPNVLAVPKNITAPTACVAFMASVEL